MTKGFMMKSNDFSIESTQTNDPQQEAVDYGISNKVAKTSKTDMMKGGHKATYFSK